MTTDQLQEVLRDNGKHISVSDDRPITLEEYHELLREAKAAGKNTTKIELIWRRWFARHHPVRQEMARPAEPPKEESPAVDYFEEIPPPPEEEVPF